MAKKSQLTTSDHLDYEEYKRFLDCLHADGKYKWEMYARVSFCTACRVSDVIQFRWKDILNVNSVSVVEKKTKKARLIPFNPSVQQKFRELYELCGRPDMKDFILPSFDPEKPVTIQYINQRLKAFKAKYNLDIDHFSTHTFRKTFGRYVYESQNKSAESLLLLNKILNHTSIQTTKTYIGITQSEINNIFSSIDV